MALSEPCIRCFIVKCRYSCKYWDEASKNVPINAEKVIKEGEKIEIKLGSRVVELPSWKWVPVETLKLRYVKCIRLCFYGKGLIRAWDECENYKPKYRGGRTFCEIGGSCEFSEICRDTRR